MNSQTLVSIIIPVYNVALYIETHNKKGGTL